MALITASPSPAASSGGVSFELDTSATQSRKIRGSASIGNGGKSPTSSRGTSLGHGSGLAAAFAPFEVGGGTSSTAPRAASSIEGFQSLIGPPVAHGRALPVLPSLSLLASSAQPSPRQRHTNPAQRFRPSEHPPRRHRSRS